VIQKCEIRAFKKRLTRDKKMPRRAFILLSFSTLREELQMEDTLSSLKKEHSWALTQFNQFS
jgi:hypothetical protein